MIRKLASLAFTDTNATRWSTVDWAICNECGEPLAGVNCDGVMYDGDDLTCLGCGIIHVVYVDAEDEDLSDAVLPTPVPTDDRLSPIGLAGLRRICKMPRTEWWGK